MKTVELGFAGIHSGSVVLDIGCGGGRHTFAALELGADVIALDSCITELEATRQMLVALTAQPGNLSAFKNNCTIDMGSPVPRSRGRATVVAGDALRLPFPDSTFTCVIASEVFEHVLDDTAAMAEVVRVLRPGAIVAISVPRFLPELVNWTLSKEYHSKEGGHIRIYRLSQLLARLSSVGLVPIRRHYAHGLHSPYWWLRCIVGVDRQDHWAVAAYHKLLVWEMERSPWITRMLGRILDRSIGKSLVVYLVANKSN